jgi:hypothetical protein
MPKKHADLHPPGRRRISHEIEPLDRYDVSGVVTQARGYYYPDGCFRDC